MSKWHVQDDIAKPMATIVVGPQGDGWIVTAHVGGKIKNTEVSTQKSFAIDRMLHWCNLNKIPLDIDSTFG
jgi:hypothetical protein